MADQNDYFNLCSVQEKNMPYNDDKFKKCADYNESLGNYINADISIDTPDETLRDTVLKVMTREHMLKEILLYEFNNYTYSVQLYDVTDVIIFAKYLLKRYQGIIEGYEIEDFDWIEEKNYSRFKYEENSKVLVNTAPRSSLKNEQLDIFIGKIIKIIKSVCAFDITIKYRRIDDENNGVCWLILSFIYS
jgi:hypothetical protein